MSVLKQIDWDGAGTALAFMEDHLAIDVLQEVARPVDPYAGILVSKVVGFLGLKKAMDTDADVFERVDGAIDFLKGQLGSAAAFAHAGSDIGAASATAGALATVAGFLAVASLTLTAFALMGKPLYQAIEQETIKGEKLGEKIGFAAAATGADEAWVKNEIVDVFRSLPGTSVEVARNDAILEGVRKGYKQGSELSSAQKTDYQLRILRFAADHGVRVDGSGDAYTNLVYGLARTALMHGAPEASVKR